MIELLVVMTILIVLTSISMVNYRGISVRSRNSKRQADMTQVRSALELYRSANGGYPVQSTSDSVDNFDDLISENISVYLSTPNLMDPLDSTSYTGLYQYRYRAVVNTGQTTGLTYVLCYYVEPTSTPVAVCSPGLSSCSCP